MSPQQNHYCEHCLKDFGRGHHCCDCDTEDEAPTPTLTLDLSVYELACKLHANGMDPLSIVANLTRIHGHEAYADLKRFIVDTLDDEPETNPWIDTDGGSS